MGFENRALVQDARTLAVCIEPGRFDYGATEQAPKMLERLADALEAVTWEAPTAEEWATTLRAERERQVAKGYDSDHDREHGVGHLLKWAIDYARQGKFVQSTALILAALEVVTEQED